MLNFKNIPGSGSAICGGGSFAATSQAPWPGF